MRGARCYPPHIALLCTNPTRQIASQMMAYGVGGVPGPGDWSHFFWLAPLYPGGPSKLVMLALLLVTAGPCCCTWCDNLYQYMIKLLKVLLVTEVLPKGSVVACWAHAVLYLQPCYELPTNLWCPLTKLPHGHPAPDTCTESPAATWSTASSLHTTLKAGYNQGTGKCRQGCGVLLGGTLGPCPMQS